MYVQLNCNIIIQNISRTPYSQIRVKCQDVSGIICKTDDGEWRVLKKSFYSFCEVYQKRKWLSTYSTYSLDESMKDYKR